MMAFSAVPRGLGSVGAGQLLTRDEAGLDPSTHHIALSSYLPPSLFPLPSGFVWCQLLGSFYSFPYLNLAPGLLTGATLLHKCSLVLVAPGLLFSASKSISSARRVNMPLALSPVPEISISLASPEEPAPEPFSPFSECSFLSDDYDSFRPTLLSPPPPSAVSPRQLSPLRPKDAPVTGKGLERERFEALLQASRERNAAVGSKRPNDLRKEIALKVHKSKQSESSCLTPPSHELIEPFPCCRSGTSCSLPLQSTGTSFPVCSPPSGHPSRISCGLPLLPSLPGTRIPSRGLRGLVSRPFHCAHMPTLG